MSSTSVDLSVIQAREASYFAAFGSPVFSCTLAQAPLLDVEFAENLAINVLSDREILANASRQGDIGTTSRAGLPDAHSRKEHGSVDFDKSAATLVTIREIAEIYQKRHGIKFMVFASGKSAEEMLEILKARLDRPTHLEWAEARGVMFKIFLRRIGEVSHKYDDAETTSDQASIVDAHALMRSLFKRHPVEGATVTATWGSSSPSHTPQEITTSNDAGQNDADQDDSSNNNNHWHFGSAGKIIATAFCLEYFAAHNMPLTTSANSLLASVKSSFRIKDGDAVTLEDLLFSTHSSVTATRPVVALKALAMFPAAGTPLTNGHLLEGLVVVGADKTSSNGNNNEAGLLVCQHIIQSHIKDEDDKPLSEATSDFFRKCGVSEYLFYPSDQHQEDEESVESLAFGLRGNESIAKGFHTMLLHIVTAYHDVRGSGAISHDSARKLLFAFANTTTASSNTLLLMRSVSNNRYIVINGSDNRDSNKYFALQCYDGADRGKGFVVASTSDSFNAEYASRGCCHALVFRGFDFYESAAEIAKNEKSATEDDSSSSTAEEQRNFYTRHLLRFFAPSESNTANNENRQLAEEITTSRGEIAARFALLGHGGSSASSVFDAASLEYGADVVVTPAVAATFATSNSEHQYVAMCRRALNPRPPLSMFDGFLNNDHPRKATQKSEDLTISLHHPVAIHRIEIDFSQFSNHEQDNSVADFIEIVGVPVSMAHHQNNNNNSNLNQGIILVPKTAVKHFAGTVKVFEITDTSLNHVQVETIVVKNYPGGGFNRIKCFAKRVFF